MEILERKHWVSRDEFKKFITKPLTQEVFGVYDISLRLDPDQMFDVLDLEDRGSLTFKQLSSALLSLCDSRDHPHAFCIRHDVYLAKQELQERLRSCKKHLEDATVEGAKQLEQQFSNNLDHVSEAALRCTEALEKATAERRTAPRHDIAGLVQQAVTKVRLLNELVQKGEAELRESLAHEELLRARLAVQNRTKGIQTERTLSISQSSPAPHASRRDRSFQAAPIPGPAVQASQDGEEACKW